MTLSRLFSTATICLIANSYSAYAIAEITPGAFAQHQMQFSLVASNAYAFDEEYFVVGVGLNYFVLDGLSLGANLETWTGGEPRLNKVTPSIQYVLWQLPNIKPYAGAFYRRVYIESQDDLESAGGRAGAYFQAGSNTYMGAGFVYEKYADCNEQIFEECSETYPEFVLSLSF